MKEMGRRNSDSVRSRESFQTGLQPQYSAVLGKHVAPSLIPLISVNGVTLTHAFVVYTYTVIRATTVVYNQAEM
jgi:hypothetical protein